MQSRVPILHQSTPNLMFFNYGDETGKGAVALSPTNSDESRSMLLSSLVSLEVERRSREGREKV